MSLNNMFNIGVSGLMTAQQRLRVTSDNISNVNTEGYIRKVATQETVVLGNQGSGVAISDIRLAADRFLQSQALSANANAEAANISASLLDQLQASFGDITNENALFSQANAVMASFLTAAETPNSSASRQEVLGRVRNVLNEGARLSGHIQSMRQEAEKKIGADVNIINTHLKDIADLNVAITAASINGTDATGALNQQSAIIDQLSKLMDVTTAQSESGAIHVRTGSGALLVGPNGASKIDYQSQGKVDVDTAFGAMTITTADGASRDLRENLKGGELKGLLDFRDTDSVNLHAQLNTYLNTYADTLNAAHNENSAVPAPASLNGKTLALTQTEAMSGFTGQTHLVLLDSAGNVNHDLLIDFDTQTLSLDGGASLGFAAGSFASDVTSALGGAATVSFTNGAMSVTASKAGGNDGVAIVQPDTNASAKLGQGFSHFFGLNDLIRAQVPTSTATGLSPASNHGFTAGDEITFRLKTANGGALSDIKIAIPAATTMTDLVNTLNDTTNGVGKYGTFSLNPATGTLSFKGFQNPANTLSVVSDKTARLSTTGPSFSQFFGIGGAEQRVVSGLNVNPTINNDSQQLALAKVNLSVSGTNRSLVAGDGAGAIALASIKDRALKFEAAGLQGATTATLDSYGSNLAGQIGSMAKTAERNFDTASMLQVEAQSRRASVEGVNLDEELVNLTNYQQAYAASGRVIQAAKELFDVLLNL